MSPERFQELKAEAQEIINDAALREDMDRIREIGRAQDRNNPYMPQLLEEIYRNLPPEMKRKSAPIEGDKFLL